MHDPDELAPAAVIHLVQDVDVKPELVGNSTDDEKIVLCQSAALICNASVLPLDNSLMLKIIKRRPARPLRAGRFFVININGFVNAVNVLIHSGGRILSI